MVDIGNLEVMDCISEIIPKKLYLTNAVGAYDLDELKNLKIKYIINLNSNNKPHEKEGIKYNCVAEIIDLEEAADIMEKHIQPLVDCIDEQILQNNAVIVHCAAGISRSATIVIAYLVLKQKMSLKQAFELVRQKRPIIFPNVGFFGVLQKIEKVQNNNKNSITLEEYIKFKI